MASKIIKMILKMKSPDDSFSKEFDVDSFVVGRSNDVDVTYSHEEVSRKHLLVFTKSNQIFLKDLGSKNGTFVNGKRIPTNTEYLYIEGNPITLGKSQAIFKLSTERASEVVPPPKSSSDSITDETDIIEDILETDNEIYSGSADDVQGSGYRPGEVFNLSEETDTDNSGLREVLGASRLEEQNELDQISLPSIPVEQEENKPSPNLKTSQSFKSKSTLPPSVVSENPSRPIRNRNIRIHPKNRSGGYKSPSELMVEVVREVGRAIDKQFINIPEDKKAKKKAEGILYEVYKLADELKQKAYQTHDRIVDKGINKANAMVADAESRSETALQEVRRKVESIEARTKQEADLEAARIVEDAKVRADKLEAEASAKAMQMKSTASDEVAVAKTEAAQIVSAAEAQVQKLRAEQELQKKQLLQELSDLESQRESAKDKVALEQQSLNSWEGKRQEAQEKIEELSLAIDKKEAELALENQRIEQEIEKKELSVQEQRQSLDAHLSELDEEWSTQQEKFQKQVQELQDKLQRKKDENDKVVAEFLAEVEARKNKVEEEFSYFEAEWVEKKNAQQKYFENEIMILERSYQNKSREFKEKLATEQKQYERQSKELKASYDKYTKETEHLIRLETQNFKQTMDGLDRRSQAKSKELDTLNAKYNEISELVQKMRGENQSLLDKLDRAEDEHKKLVKEKQSLVQSQAKLAKELENTGKRKQDLLQDIDDLSKTHKVELENLAKIKSETLDKIANDKKMAAAEIEAKKQAFEHEIQQLQQKSEAEREHLIAEAQRQSEVILENAQTQNQSIIKTANEIKSQAEQYSADLAKQTEKWKLEQEQDIQHQRGDLEGEIAKRLKASKKQLEMELADIRVRREQELLASLDKLQENHDKTLAEKAEVIARSMDQKLLSRIKPHLKDHDDTRLIDEISIDFQKTLLQVLDPAKQYEDEELKRVIGINSAQLIKDGGFWKKTLAITAVVMLVVGTPMLWEKFKTETREMASEQKQTATDVFVKKIEEKRKNKPKYEPEMTNEFLGSYTDRVLYTRSYVKNELNKGFRQQWILKLDEFFVDELGLSDNVIVTFIAKEANVLKELQGMRDGINPQFENESRADMMAVEKRFTDEVRRVLESSKNYKKFQSFKQKFYTNHYKQ